MILDGPVTRDGAREEARRELSKSIYEGREPGWWNRVVDWINDRLSDLFDWIMPNGGHGPGGSGGLGVLALVLALVAVTVAVRWWLGPVHRTARSKADPTDLSSPLTAAELRAEADAHAARGAYAEAVRSRLRAIVRMLEEKGVLDSRPGRTAGELVAEVARFAPAPAPAPAASGSSAGAPARTAQTGRGSTTGGGPTAALAHAVEVFSEIWYGGQPASAHSYESLLVADAALAGLRRGSGGTTAADSFPVPA